MSTILIGIVSDIRTGSPGPPGLRYAIEAMLSRRLIAAVESNAHKLAQDVVEENRKNPILASYSQLSDEQYVRVVQDLYSELGQWLTSRTWHRLQVAYERKGRERFGGGIPLEQLIYSLGHTKRRLLEYIRTAIPGSADERDMELELIMAIDEFFDKAIYHTISGYEDARRLRAEGSSAPAEHEIAASVAKATEKFESPLTGVEGELPSISRAGDVGETSG